MNTTLLRRIQSHLREEPRRLNMTEWKQVAKPSSYINCSAELGRRYPVEVLLDETTAPPCGTVACIAGWAREFQKRELVADSRWLNDTELFDLSLDTLQNLFYVNRWPNRDLAERYPKATSASERVEIVCAVIDECIETNGWESK